MKDVDLALEGRDGCDTTIDRVSNPCIRLIHQTAHSIDSLPDGDLLQPFSPTTCISLRVKGEKNLQELVNIAGTEDPVYIGKLLWLIGGEVRRKDAVLCTSPPQQLAGRTWPHHPAAASRLPEHLSHLFTHPNFTQHSVLSALSFFLCSFQKS